MPILFFVSGLTSARANRFFISYRRDDSIHETGRLCDRLIARFGPDRVFKDVDNIPLGVDFRQVLQDEVQRCAALLVIIGSRWLDAADAQGARRLDEPDDFVRFEIATALRADIPVIPLLFGRAAMPTEDQLPEDIRELAFRNGLRIQPDPNFHQDVDRLIEQLMAMLPAERSALAGDGTANAASVVASAPEIGREEGPSAAAHHAGPAGSQTKARQTTTETSDGRRMRVSRRAIWVALVALPIVVAMGFGLRTWFGRPEPFTSLSRSEIEQQVAIAQAAAPMILTSQPAANFREVPTITFSDNSAFEFVSDHRVFDLRRWKDVPADKLGEHYSVANMTRHLRLLKNREADWFDTEARTSGIDCFLTCLDLWPFIVEAQTNDSFVGNDRLKVRKLSVNVSTIGVGREFDVNVIATHWNSVQTQQEQWFGLIGYKGSFVASMLVLFPASKPFTDYQLMVSLTAKDTPQPYRGQRAVITGPRNDWVYWEVPHPEAGHVYRLQWNW